jgi:hypothetical protein
MRKTIEISFDVDVYEAACLKAYRNATTFTTYVEGILRRDLDIVTAEPLLRIVDYRIVRNEFAVVREAGETDEEYAERVEETSEIVEASRIFDPKFKG